LKNPIIVLASAAALIILAVCHVAAGEIQLTSNEEIDSFAVSPDGNRIIFNKKKDNPNLLLRTLEDGTTTIIAAPSNRTWHMARWSPAGDQVVVTSAASPNRIYDMNDMQIAIVNITSGASQTLTAGPGVRIFPFYSPDGKSIFYFKGRVRKSGMTPAAGYDLYKIDIAGGNEQRLTNQEFYQASGGDSLPGTDVVVFVGVGGKDYHALEREKRWGATSEELNSLYLYHSNEARLERIVTGMIATSRPKFSKEGDVYFVGAENKRGKYHFGIFKFALLQAITSKVIDVVPNPIDYDVFREGHVFYVKGLSKNKGSLESIRPPSLGKS
jgi:Tol biopolymer transport system component